MPHKGTVQGCQMLMRSSKMQCKKSSMNLRSGMPLGIMCAKAYLLKQVGAKASLLGIGRSQKSGSGKSECRTIC